MRVRHLRYIFPFVPFRFANRILPILLGISFFMVGEITPIITKAHAQQSGRVSLVCDPGVQGDKNSGSVINAPATYEQNLAGTSLPILPECGGQLINAGAPADSITGLDNLIGPYLGSAPDVGMYELGLGLPWHGPRDFTNLLAYGRPSGWRVGTISEVGNYQSLGSPASVAANDFRLLLIKDSVPAFILVIFHRLSGNDRWDRYEDILDGDPGDVAVQEIPTAIEFRDGLGARIVGRSSAAALLGARVDDEGVLNVIGGVAAGSFGMVQDDMFTFMRSLYYPWYLQDPTSPQIAIDFVAPPAPGVVAVGETASSSGNAVVAGKLHGDVTLTSASIIWDVGGDADLDATASVRFRRQGTDPWRDALDLSRVDHDYGGRRNRITGSIFALSPGTTYEVEVSVSDPDGGSATRATTFTTRSVAKVTNPANTIEVTTSNFNAILNSAGPGDTLRFHGGIYNDGSEWTIPRTVNGTRENPILLRAYGDGDVEFAGINIRGDNIWIDGFHIGDGGIDDDGYLPIGITISRNTITATLVDAWSGHCIDADGTDWTAFDNYLNGGHNGNCVGSQCYAGEGIEFAGRGHVAAYNRVTGTGDSFSYGDGNIDIHNNIVFVTTDDFIEPDYAWDNYRLWENQGHDRVRGFSFQPINGGPWYIFRNQLTGEPNPFKLRSGKGEIFIVANSFVSGNAIQNSHYLFQNGGLFANNYIKTRGSDGSEDFGYGSAPSSAQIGAMRLWGHNVYDPERYIWRWWQSGDDHGLPAARAAGAEINSFTVTGGPPPNQAPQITSLVNTAVDRDLSRPDIQICEGDTVTYGAVAIDPDRDPVTWTWFLSVNGEPSVQRKSGQGAVGDEMYIYGAGTTGSIYRWELQISDGFNPPVTAEVIMEVVPPDTAAPIISNVQTAGLTSVSAIITWATDEPADSHVQYGPDSAYGSSRSDGEFVQNHSVSLSGLSADTIYHFRVRSSDPSGNVSLFSADAGFSTNDLPPYPVGGLVGHWSFDDGSGMFALDDSGNSNDGALQNGVPWIAGVVAGAVQLDGIDDFVEVSNSTSLQITGNEVSIAGWTKLPQAGIVNDLAMVCKGPQTNNERYMLGVNADETINFRLTTSSGYRRVDGGSVPVGRWIHLAAVYDGSAMHTYIDGVLDTTTLQSGDIRSELNPIFIGKRCTGDDRYFQGALDDVFVYDRALTATEVNQLKNLQSLDNTPPSAPVNLRVTH